MSINPKEFFAGNKNLRAAGSIHNYTHEELLELAKCKNNPIYFINNYCKVAKGGVGLVNLKLFDYQYPMLESFIEHDKSIVVAPRQCGKSTTFAAYALWCILFKQSYTVAILANKLSVAKEILDRVQNMFLNVPRFLQQGVLSFSKTSMELENKSKIFVSTTSASGIRGFAIDLVFLDEFAHIQDHIANDFFTSTYPTISATGGKLIIVSTPKGMNHFHKMWKEAISARSGFNPVFVNYRDIPLYNKKWAEATKKDIGAVRFAQEYECDFLGSVNTLISPTTIQNMTHDNPITTDNNGISIYEEPIAGQSYLITCDTSEGVGGDNTAFLVFDVTDYPITVVAKFASNIISPFLLPRVLYEVGAKYNYASILVESNNLGKQVVNDLYMELEYPNLIGESFHSPTYGVRTTKSTKAIGCATFKDLCETQRLLVIDHDIIEEISNFVKHKTSYAASEGHKDDLVMCCVLMSWFASTEQWDTIRNSTFRKEIYEARQKQMEEMLMPFGIISNGITEFGYSQSAKSINTIMEEEKLANMGWVTIDCSNDAFAYHNAFRNQEEDNYFVLL
jgi:hypothetical protein